MAAPLAPESISLTAAGAGLVSGPDGTIDPADVAGLFVDDCRVVSRWRWDVDGAGMRPAGRRADGPSGDELVFTWSAPGVIDPIGTFTRRRSLERRRLTERVEIRAYAEPIEVTLRLTLERDELTVYEIDPGRPATVTAARPTAGSTAGRFAIDAPPVATNGRSGPHGPVGQPAVVTIDAHRFTVDDDGRLVTRVEVPVGSVWGADVVVDVGELADRPTPSPVAVAAADSASMDAPGPGLDSRPDELGRLVAQGRRDLRALTVPCGEQAVFAAGSPFFLALFGRDSLIAGMQALIDTPERLADILVALAERQATTDDPTTRARPGLILHELRLGRMGVFGVPPGRPYYGAIDSAALFTVALGEAAAWGAPPDVIRRLLPAAESALAWCATIGDVDGDGFVESVPDPDGLTNLGWKDSGDSMVRDDGSTFVGPVALAEVQGYWYRALRSHAGMQRWLELDDGGEADRQAAELATRFAERFVYDADGAPFVALAIADRTEVLHAAASNAGHVLWSGILPAALAGPVADRLATPDLDSGWGLRTLSAHAAGYNPFGYHRGTVWPHDTAIAVHGASRYGATGPARRLADGIVGLGAATSAQLPELISGLGRDESDVPIPYLSACRPQAWAAGASLQIMRGLCGLEPDVPAGTVRLHPVLADDQEIVLTGVRLGDHTLDAHVRGTEVVTATSTLDVVTGPDDRLPATGWCPA